MVRVLHITTEFPPVIFGGLGTAVGGLVTASARSGVAVGVLLVGGVLAVEADRQGGYGQPGVAAPTASETEQTVVGPDGVTFFQISPSDPVEAAVRVVQAWRPDVLHLHTAWVWPFAQAILDRTGLPLVYTVHSVDRAEYELGQEPGHILAHAADQERAIAVADRIIALTRNEHDLLVHYYPESRPRIHIVGNGIDDGDAAYAAVASKAPTDAPLVLYTGRLVERKGIRELLAAIPLILERAPRTRFVLAGGPPPVQRSGTRGAVAATRLRPVSRPDSLHRLADAPPDRSMVLCRRRTSRTEPVRALWHGGPRRHAIRIADGGDCRRRAAGHSKARTYRPAGTTERGRAARTGPAAARDRLGPAPPDREGGRS